ncbi:hypothetical protein ACIQ9E_06730 [Streptomyces sp. NPDC094448]|uniref:hypothetical protein n=1 Tax=Streptomyces sp. NPDC094448 TaxID=3366063 RepID=UPI003815744B
MSSSFSRLLGDRQRFRSASSASWRAIEEWVGEELPHDYRELVDGYGDAVLAGHLYLPHPEGSEPLLGFMEDHQGGHHTVYREEDVARMPDSVSAVWSRIVPWAYHDWNGDECLLLPPTGKAGWQVAVSFRQYPGVTPVPGGTTEFIEGILSEDRMPRGWPKGRPAWKSIEDSPLI